MQRLRYNRGEPQERRPVTEPTCFSSASLQENKAKDEKNQTLVEKTEETQVLEEISTDFERMDTGSAVIRPPSALSFQGNVSENWRKWRQSFENYLLATGFNTKPEPRQIALLLTVIGEEANEKYDTFELSETEKVEIKSVLGKFESYCSPKKNESVESYFFFSRNQKEGESNTEYITELKRLSASCGFKDLQDRLIRDKIVWGVLDNTLKEKLLKEEDLTLEKCIKICQTVEITDHQLKSMENIEKKN